MKNPFLNVLSAAALLWMGSTHASGQEPVISSQLILDINESGTQPDSTVKSMVNMGSGLVLAIDSPATGSEIWYSDGSEAGTVLLADIVPGPVGSEPLNLTVVPRSGQDSQGNPLGPLVFFSAFADEDGAARSLWATDGTKAGTQLLYTFNVNQPPVNFAAFNGKLIFSGYDAINQRELWESDGTPGGTRMNRNIHTGNSPTGSSPADFFNLDDTFLYFTAFDPNNGRELWRMNRNFNAVLHLETAANQSTYFTGGPTGNEPAEITHVDIVDVDPGTAGVAKEIFFVGRVAQTGREVYMTDGVGSLAPAADVAPNQESSDPRLLTPFSIEGVNYLYFVATTSGEGEELYRTDGVTSELIRDLATTAESSSIAELTPVGNRLFFSADVGSGRALYRSNGIPGGSANTAMVSNSILGSEPQNLTAFSGNLLLFSSLAGNGSVTINTCTTVGEIGEPLITFPQGTTISKFVTARVFDTDVAYFMVNGSQLWVTDALTEGGTAMVYDFQGATAGSQSRGFAVDSNGIAYFSATNGEDGKELWRTDGTTEGTYMVTDLNEGEAGSDPLFITPSGSKVFFSAEAESGNRELWMTEGTALTTDRVLTTGGAEINNGGPSDPTGLIDANGVIYFSAQGTTSGREPWMSDGTIAGTRIVRDLVTGSGGSDPANFTVYKGDVYFTSTANGQQNRLRSVSNPVVPLQDATTPNSAGPINPENLVVAGTGNSQRLYFTGEIAGKGKELWKTDGTNETTVCIDIIPGSTGSEPEHLTAVGNTVYFVATGLGGTTGSTGRELWRSNGDITNTRLVRDIVPGDTSSNPENLTASGNRLFFTAETPANGRELWVSNGTQAGTFMVKDIKPGAEGSSIHSMTDANGLVVFAADDGVNGVEFWLSDGTEDGTFMLEDLSPATSASNPTAFTPFRGQLLYSAQDPAAGDEPRLAFVGPNIEVYYDDERITYNGSALVPDIVDVGETVTFEIKIRNTGISTLNSIRPLISGTNASEYKLGQPRAPKSIGPGEEASFGINFKPKEGGTREATISIISDDGDENPFVFTVRTEGLKDLWISQQPQSAVRNVGESVTFEATVSSRIAADVATAQWRRNTAKIKEAVVSGPVGGGSSLSTSYSLSNLTLKNAGGYNIFVQGENEKAYSNSGLLAIVEPNDIVPVLTAGLGATARIKVKAAGTNLVYQWLKNGTPISDNNRVSGTGSATLVIQGLVGADTAEYSCAVSNPSGEIRFGGQTQLNIYTQAPDVLDNQNMPGGIVGGFYSHQTRINNNSQRSPLRYAATGLPPGVRMDAKTGLISGRPTRDGEFSIIIKASNGIGEDLSVPQIITVSGFPTDLDGVYVAAVGRNAVLNNNLGGRLDLTVNKRGTFTGKLTLGTATVPVRGGLTIPVSGINSSLVLNVTPNARTGLPPMTLTVAFRNNGAGLADECYLTSGSDSVQFTGWKRIAKEQALRYAATYNLGMRLDGAQPDTVPQGWSFMTMKAATNGTARLTGQTADGEKITASVPMGIRSDRGKVIFYQKLYKPAAGSMLGIIDINHQATDQTLDNTVTGTADWVRPAETSVKGRAYQEGFGLPGTPVTDPVDLDIVGAFYDTRSKSPVLGTTGLPAPLALTFTGAGIGDEANITITLGDKNKITQDSAVTKLKPFSISRGMFSGTVTLADKRKFNFQGALIKDGSTQIGAGYFLLPQPPEEGETAKTSPVLGGKVELAQPAPPPVP